LLALLLALCILRWRKGSARQSPTWGCGYTAPSARMQYTGSSFIEHFARIFESFLPALRREHVSDETFPKHAGHLATHHADAVERRIFEVLGQGEDFLVQASVRSPAEPRFAFAAGLLVLVLIGVLVYGIGEP
jgi:hydrogenase-4 component B